MQLSLVLVTLSAAVVCQAEKRLAALFVSPMSLMPLMGRQTYEYCDAGQYECKNQDGCCPTGVACVGDGTCDITCTSSDHVCDATTCCPPGYACPGTAGGGCVKSSGGGGGGGDDTYYSDYTSYSTSYYTINPGGDYTITDYETDYDSYTDYDSHTDYDSYTDTYTDSSTDYNTAFTSDSFNTATDTIPEPTLPAANTPTGSPVPTGAAGRNSLGNLGALPLAGVVMALV